MPNSGETARLAVTFWDFSLRLYGNVQVREQLLQWQDENGANVNAALLCIWAGKRGRALTHDQLRRALSALAGWHSAVTHPLREQRRRLRNDWQHLAPGFVQTRQAILHAELEAERVEQTLLLEALRPWPAAAPGDSGNLAAVNLQTYLGAAATAAPASIIAAICSAE